MNTKRRYQFFDSSLMFSDMVFEMTRSFNGEHFKLKEHIDRLFMIKNPSNKHTRIKKDIYNLCIKTAEMNKEAFNEDDEHRLLIDVSKCLEYLRGINGIHQGYNLIIADFPLKWTVQGMGKLFTTGIIM